MRALLLIPLLLGACTDEAPVETRTCNRTGFEIAELVPYTSTVTAMRANDSCSPYRTETTDVYAYTGASFLIGSDRFERQPVDFVGEQPLRPGRWSYEIRIVDYATRILTTNAVQDDLP